MTEASVWIRGRDGAWYGDPLFSTPQAFICFDAQEPPEIVVWLNPEPPPVEELLTAMLGPDGWKRVDVARVGSRFIPGDAHPREMALARSHYFQLARRIPEPHEAKGPERYLRNCEGGPHYGEAPHPRDAYELRIGGPPQAL